MQQRVALVRAFALGSSILLMDEPFAALDEITRADMRHLLGRLCEQTGAAVLFVTHSIAESVFLSDRVVVLSSRPGRVVGTVPIDLPRPRLPAIEDDAAFFAHETRSGRCSTRAPAAASTPMSAGRDRAADAPRACVSSRPASSGSSCSCSRGRRSYGSSTSGRSCSGRRRRSCPSSSTTPRFFLDHTLTTGRHALVGILIALACALLVGAVLATSRFLEHASQPVLTLILVTPWVAYINSVVLWLGRGTPPILFMVAFVSFPAFTFATVAGLRSADPSARELLASVEASRWEVLWRLRLPSALPSLFTAARFNVGLGLAAAYFTEGGALQLRGPRLGRRDGRSASTTATCCGRRSCAPRCSAWSGSRW